MIKSKVSTVWSGNDLDFSTNKVMVSLGGRKQWLI